MDKNEALSSKVICFLMETILLAASVAYAFYHSLADQYNDAFIFKTRAFAKDELI